MPRSCCRRSTSRPRAAGFVTLGLPADYVKDLPFTGMAMHRRWAAANMSAAKRVLAATDKSIAWLADPRNRGEAVELLVKVARSSKEDAEASYDYLRRIEYFEPQQQGLAHEIAQSGRDGAAAPEPSPRASTSIGWPCRASPN